MVAFLECANQPGTGSMAVQQLAMLFWGFLAFPPVACSLAETKLCISGNPRYLAAKTTIPQHAAQDFGGQTRSPLEKMPIQPKSMVQHPAYMTPVGRRSLALAGRGRRAAEDGGPTWQPKVSPAHKNLLQRLSIFASIHNYQ